MDKFTKEKRSEIMSHVKSKNTQLELLIFNILKKNHIKFKSHLDMLGKPDIVFPRQKIAVFIDGDFWHGWRFETYRDKLTDYWINKISNNIKRDKRIRKELKAKGWIILRFWEHRIKKRPESCIKSLLIEINKVKLGDRSP